MADPWKTLGLPPQADGEEIRRRYLELVRQFPPDRAPDRFHEIRTAYDDLRDPVTRLKSQLFSLEDDGSIDDILFEIRSRTKGETISTEALLALGHN